MPTDIWRTRLRSATAHRDLELAVDDKEDEGEEEVAAGCSSAEI